MDDAERQQYRVGGMTCGHCRLSVMEEVCELAEVEDVEVDLDSDRLTVWGPGVRENQIESAVERAGYSLVSTKSAAGSSDAKATDV